jgi:hypothetical protein
VLEEALADQPEAELGLAESDGALPMELPIAAAGRD